MARGTRNKGYSLCFSTRGRTTDRDKVDFTNRDTLVLPLLLLCWLNKTPGLNKLFLIPVCIYLFLSLIPLNP